MGTLYSYQCNNCGFEATLGSQQPYHIFAGTIHQKYCPNTKEIVEVFLPITGEEWEITCCSPGEQEGSDTPRCCKECNGECLQSLTVLSLTGQSEILSYQCPCCGDVMRRNYAEKIFAD
ncbi:MAG: hypothetical protein IKB99_03025 [Lentisphaeria bacterium]|nr:hypothetical protein [Lentisphaeria bacterium]